MAIWNLRVKGYMEWLIKSVKRYDISEDLWYNTQLLVLYEMIDEDKWFPII